ncbi:MAG: YceI family protein [Blastocatellia bacterium]
MKKPCIKSGMALTTLSLLLFCAVPHGQGAARTYNLVAAESSFWVYVGKAGILKGFAHNHEIGVKSFSGRITVPAGNPAAGTLQLDVDAKSMAVLDKDVSDKDRTEIYNSMHNSVLESAKYPKISFRSVAVADVKPAGANQYSLTLSGDLTLHGVTRRIAVPATVNLTPNVLRATGKYTLRQSDYGIKPYSAAGGTIKVKDDIVVNFSLVAK